MSAKIASPRPPAPARNTSAVSPTVVVTAIRSPAMISGSASGSSTRHSSWRARQPHAAAGVARLGRDAVEARDHVAEDDQQRVGDERDHRRQLAAPGERQQQEEDRDARQRVEDAGDLRDRRDQPAPAVREQRERERDREADRDRDQRQLDVLDERLLVAVEVVGDPARAEAVALDARRLAAAERSGIFSWAKSAAITPRLRP